MLSVLYKLASTALANRLQPHLNKLIPDTQNGFIDGQYIGDSTTVDLYMILYT